MRVQHNIMAMNAYRNYNNNTKALSGNLEKLSSGYKINRAGDDAAGLAISEKMRSQITGLDAAQKNVKDGISLVKTAEGAMQEVQDMLKRMKYLATQSANGTYQNEVDRENLQKEVTSLKEEINRIADSANFNGIKLLDGSMAGEGGGGGTTAVKPTVSGFKLTDATLTSATASGTLKFGAMTSVGLGNFQVNVSLNGKTYSYNYTMKATSGMTKMQLVDDKGNVVKDGLGGLTYKAASDAFTKVTGATVAQADIGKDVAAKLAADLGADFEVSGDATLTIKSTKPGANTLVLDGMSVSYTKTDGSAGKQVIATRTQTKFGKDMYWTAAQGDFKKVAKAEDLAANTYTVNGVKFAFMTDVAEMAKVQKKDPSVHIIQMDPGTSSNAMAKFAAEINLATGVDVRVTAATQLKFYASKGGSTGGGGLTLQIGDTADSYNQMKVKIGDMHTTGGMAIDGIDISTLEGAQAAIGVVTDATNYVSSIRGDLGAIQNRLDHTLNNLSVMAENIQDAESTIRDTDVAEEMMAYTKNNILIQSAQAMLAQANQVPQGVLQLLG